MDFLFSCRAAAYLLQSYCKAREGQNEKPRFPNFALPNRIIFYLKNADLLLCFILKGYGCKGSAFAIFQQIYLGSFAIFQQIYFAYVAIFQQIYLGCFAIFQQIFKLKMISVNHQSRDLVSTGTSFPRPRE